MSPSNEPDQAVGNMTTTDIWVDGWNPAALRLQSPNVDARPAGCLAELLVIHAISLPLGQFSNDYVTDLFMSRLDCSADPEFASLAGLRVSAHFFIRRDGSVIQFAGVNQRAWHAGLSSYCGRPRCNDFSIGVELEGSDFVPFEPAQYQSLIRLTHQLLQICPVRDIVGHQDIAPDRKTDPGPFFDWVLYQNLLQQHFPLVLANAAIRGHADR